MSFPRDNRPTDKMARRAFLQSTGVTGVIAAVGAAGGTASISPFAENVSEGPLSRISEHLWIHAGPINVGIVVHDQAALLIDFGDGGVLDSLQTLGVKRVTHIAFTHYHRDQSCGVDRAAAETEILVPADERGYFTNPGEYWNNDANIWRVYRSYRPDHLMPTRPILVDNALADGDEWTFGPARIRAISTPGHTDGSLSYQVEVDGLRVVFCGDAIYDAGQVWDLYSLQKGFRKNGKTIGGYHGFMGARWTLVESLNRIKQSEPDLLVPSHGRLMQQPAEAIDLLATRFELAYENYVSISALRHYFPRLFSDYEGRPGQMPLRPGMEPPSCLRHFGTTWMLVSDTGAALVMDAGSAGVVSRLQEMLDNGEISSIDALWVTHYHYDHTSGIPQFQQKWDCPCYTDRQLAEVLANPTAWRLPCLATEPIRVDHPMEDGQSWQWREYRLTSYFYPGQTLYHAALLVEHQDLRMLFVGDSHTMGGLDDYCAQNRNFLGRDVGFQYCLSLIEKLKPTHMFNCHVDVAFTFTPQEIRFMRKKLDEREQMFGELVPWDHANFGTDASWVRCDPYTQRVQAGTEVHFGAVITNHAASDQIACARPIAPAAFGPQNRGASSQSIAAKQEGRLPLAVSIPGSVRPGRYIVPVDIQFGGWRLPAFSETILDVAGV